MNFTRKELEVIVRLCDLGVRQGGLEAANIAIPIAAKAQQMMQAMDTAEKVATMPLTAFKGNGTDAFGNPHLEVRD